MLIDTTLREGEQCYGVYFTPSQKQKCITRLARLGVEEIELGVQGQEDLPALLRLARELAPETAHSIWCRGKAEDVNQAAVLGCRLNVGLPASEAHARQRLGREPGEMPALAREIVTLAKDRGCAYVSLGLEDVSRADLDVALDMAAAALEAGASRIRLADSVGILDPGRMQELVRTFRSELGARFPDFDLAVHCHNDFGMATGNAVAALTAGADYADVSLLGAGERAGIARTEELAAWLALRAGRAAYRLEELRELCEMVSLAAQLPSSRLHPVVGRDVFAAESGLHVHALEKDPALFEPYAPETVRAERRLGVGKKSGRAAVRATLAKLGVEVSGASLPLLVAACRKRSAGAGRPLAEKELLALMRQMGQCGDTGPRHSEQQGEPAAC